MPPQFDEEEEEDNVSKSDVVLKQILKRRRCSSVWFSREHFLTIKKIHNLILYLKYLIMRKIEWSKIQIDGVEF